MVIFFVLFTAAIRITSVMYWYAFSSFVSRRHALVRYCRILFWLRPRYLSIIIIYWTIRYVIICWITALENSHLVARTLWFLYVCHVDSYIYIYIYIYIVGEANHTVTYLNGKGWGDRTPHKPCHVLVFNNILISLICLNIFLILTICFYFFVGYIDWLQTVDFFLFI